MRHRIRTILLSAGMLLVLGACFTASGQQMQIHARAEGSPTAQIMVQAQLKLDGKEIREKKRNYTFVLEAVGEAPLPPKTEVVLSGAGQIRFGNAYFTAPGDYRYRLFQRAGKEAEEGLTLDLRIYELSIQVTSDEEGNLAAAAVYSLAGKGVKREPEFVNRFKAPPAPGKKDAPPPKTGRNGKSGGLSVKTADETPIFRTLLLLLASAVILLLRRVNARRKLGCM